MRSVDAKSMSGKAILSVSDRFSLFHCAYRMAFNSSGAQHFPIRRNLLQGSPSRGEALARQLHNLRQFVSDNQAEFDAMPYEPWTKAPRGFKSPENKVGAATVARGIRGVYLLNHLRTRDAEKQLFLYPGVLMTEELYNRFSQQYYCPTALEVPALNYKVNRDGFETKVEMLVVADPTSIGALLNDCSISGRIGKSACCH